MTDQRHILLIESCENEIEFFRDALKESGLGFLFTTARSIQQALTILQRNTADIIFINVHLAIKHSIVSAKKIKSICSSPVVFYSNVSIPQSQLASDQNVNYVQLPASIQSMGKILKNLFAIRKSQQAPEGAADNLNI